MNIQGVIFDFNGTLFWDTEYHNKAWDIYLANHNQHLTDQQKDVFIHGKPNRDIFEFLEKRKISEFELESKIEEKEGIYRDICRNLNLSLAPGAEDFLEFLKISKIPFTIATSSGWGNVKFYFEYLNLGKWFSLDKVVYDDESYKGKPEPDIFLIAAHKLDLPIKLCAIFEDSITGLKAAYSAKAGAIFFVHSNNLDVPSGIDAKTIIDFNQVDRKMFFLKTC